MLNFSLKWDGTGNHKARTSGQSAHALRVKVHLHFGSKCRTGKKTKLQRKVSGALWVGIPGQSADFCNNNISKLIIIFIMIGVNVVIIKK